MARKEKQRLPLIEAYYLEVWPTLRHSIHWLKDRVREMKVEVTSLERLSRWMTKMSWADERRDPEAAAEEFKEFAASVMKHLEDLTDRFCPRPEVIVSEVPVTVQPKPSIN